jgi:uncharacterized lipoprotein NlpE involved in copper resistance
MKKLFVLVGILAVLFLVGCTNDDDRYVEGVYYDTVFLTAGTWVTFDTRGNTLSLDMVNEAGERHPMAGTAMTGRFNARILADSEYTFTITGNGRFSISWR